MKDFFVFFRDCLGILIKQVHYRDLKFHLCNEGHYTREVKAVLCSYYE